MNSHLLRYPLLTLCLMVLLMGQFSTAVQAQRRAAPRNLVEENHFLYSIPKTWRSEESDNSDFHIAFGIRENNFTPNATFGIEQFNGPIHDYLAALKESFEQNQTKFKILSQSEFKQRQQIKTAKMVVNNQYETENGILKLTQTWYAFQQPDSYTVMITTRLTDDPRKLDEEFDRIAQSFRFTKTAEMPAKEEPKGQLVQEGEGEYMIPKDWTFDPDSKEYHMAFPPHSETSGANFLIVAEEFEGTLNDYAQALTNDLIQDQDFFEVLSWDEFENSSKIPALRIVIIRGTQEDQTSVYQFLYLFEHKDTCYVLIGSNQIYFGRQSEGEFDEIAKTFRIKE